MTDLEYFKLALASLHQGGWYNWKTHDADGNKIAPIDRDWETNKKTCCKMFI